MKLRAGFLVAVFLCTGMASVASAGPLVGPTGRYYLTDESGFNQIWQFQGIPGGGTTFTTFPAVPSNLRHGPIIVDGNAERVRTVRGGFSGGVAANPGSTYDYNGVVQGGPLNLDFSAHSGAGRVIDAAFDGTNSYIVDHIRKGVYRYNADFSGPGTLVFNVSEADVPQGITYDTTTDTIWVSEYGGGEILQYDLSGNLLSRFDARDDQGVLSTTNTSLAYDFSDDTFWFNAHRARTMGFGIGELWQFDRNGNFLQKIHGAQFGGPDSILYWGGEIRATGEANVVPEPASLAIWSALGGIGLLAARRRKRRAKP